MLSNLRSFHLMFRSKVHISTLSIRQIRDGFIDESNALCGDLEDVLAFVAQHEECTSFDVLCAEGIECCTNFGGHDDLFHGG